MSTPLTRPITHLLLLTMVAGIGGPAGLSAPCLPRPCHPSAMLRPLTAESRGVQVGLEEALTDLEKQGTTRSTYDAATLARTLLDALSRHEQPLQPGDPEISLLRASRLWGGAPTAQTLHRNTFLLDAINAQLRKAFKIQGSSVNQLRKRGITGVHIHAFHGFDAPRAAERLLRALATSKLTSLHPDEEGRLVLSFKEASRLMQGFPDDTTLSKNAGLVSGMNATLQRAFEKSAPDSKHEARTYACWKIAQRLTPRGMTHVEIKAFTGYDPASVADRLLEAYRGAQGGIPEGDVAVAYKTVSRLLGGRPSVAAFSYAPDFVAAVNAVLGAAFRDPAPDPQKDPNAHARWTVARALIQERKITGLRVAKGLGSSGYDPAATAGRLLEAVGRSAPPVTGPSQAGVRTLSLTRASDLLDRKPFFTALAKNAKLVAGINAALEKAFQEPPPAPSVDPDAYTRWARAQSLKSQGGVSLIRLAKQSAANGTNGSGQWRALSSVDLRKLPAKPVKVKHKYTSDEGTIVLQDGRLTSGNGRVITIQFRNEKLLFPSNSPFLDIFVSEGNAKSGLEESPREQVVGWLRGEIPVVVKFWEDERGLDGRVFVSGKPVGVVRATYRQDTVVLDLIRVGDPRRVRDPDRGPGAGTVVLKWLLEWARRRGLHEFETEVRNPRLLRIFYKNRLLDEATVTDLDLPVAPQEDVPWDEFYRESRVDELPNQYRSVSWLLRGRLAGTGLEEDDGEPDGFGDEPDDRLVGGIEKIGQPVRAKKSLRERRSAGTYWTRARKHIKAGEYPEAEQDLSTLIEINGPHNRRNIPAYLHRAKARMALGKYAQAEEDTSQVIQLDGRNYLAHFVRAQARRALGQLAHARDDARTVLDLSDFGLQDRPAAQLLAAIEADIAAPPAPGTQGANSGAGLEEDGPRMPERRRFLVELLGRWNLLVEAYGRWDRESATTAVSSAVPSLPNEAIYKPSLEELRDLLLPWMYDPETADVAVSAINLRTIVHGTPYYLEVVNGELKKTKEILEAFRMIPDGGPLLPMGHLPKEKLLSPWSPYNLQLRHLGREEKEHLARCPYCFARRINAWIPPLLGDIERVLKNFPEKTARGIETLESFQDPLFSTLDPRLVEFVQRTPPDELRRLLRQSLHREVHSISSSLEGLRPLLTEVFRELPDFIDRLQRIVAKQEAEREKARERKKETIGRGEPEEVKVQLAPAAIADLLEQLDRLYDFRDGYRSMDREVPLWVESEISERQTLIASARRTGLEEDEKKGLLMPGRREFITQGALGLATGFMELDRFLQSLPLSQIGSSMAAVKPPRKVLLELFDWLFPKKFPESWASHRLPGEPWVRSSHRYQDIDRDLGAIQEAARGLQKMLSGKRGLPPAGHIPGILIGSWLDWEHLQQCPYCRIRERQHGLEDQMGWFESDLPGYRRACDESIQAIRHATKEELLSFAKAFFEQRHSNHGRVGGEATAARVVEEFQKIELFIQRTPLANLQRWLIEALTEDMKAIEQKFTLLKTQTKRILTEVPSLLERYRPIAKQQDEEALQGLIRELQESFQGELPFAKGHLILLAPPAGYPMDDWVLVEQAVQERGLPVRLERIQVRSKDLFSRAIQIARDFAQQNPEGRIGIVVGRVDLERDAQWISALERWAEELHAHYPILQVSFLGQKEDFSDRGEHGAIPCSRYFTHWASQQERGLVFVSAQQNIPPALRHQLNHHFHPGKTFLGTLYEFLKMKWWDEADRLIAKADTDFLDSLPSVRVVQLTEGETILVIQKHKEVVGSYRVESLAADGTASLRAIADRQGRQGLVVTEPELARQDWKLYRTQGLLSVEESAGLEEDGPRMPERRAFFKTGALQWLQATFVRAPLAPPAESFDETGGLSPDDPLLRYTRSEEYLAILLRILDPMSPSLSHTFVNQGTRHFAELTSEQIIRELRDLQERSFVASSLPLEQRATASDETLYTHRLRGWMNHVQSELANLENERSRGVWANLPPLSPAERQQAKRLVATYLFAPFSNARQTLLRAGFTQLAEGLTRQISAEAVAALAAQFRQHLEKESARLAQRHGVEYTEEPPRDDALSKAQVEKSSGSGTTAGGVSEEAHTVRAETSDGRLRSDTLSRVTPRSVDRQMSVEVAQQLVKEVAAAVVPDGTWHVLSPETIRAYPALAPLVDAAAEQGRSRFILDDASHGQAVLQLHAIPREVPIETIRYYGTAAEAEVFRAFAHDQLPPLLEPGELDRRLVTVPLSSSSFQAFLQQLLPPVAGAAPIDYDQLASALTLLASA